MNNVFFSESKFAVLFQCSRENNFWRQKLHLMKEWSLQNKLINLVLKSSVSAPNHITVIYLLFALIDMETEILTDNFQIKSYTDNSLCDQTVCFESLKRPCSITC